MVKYSWFLGNRRALFALASTGMTMVFESFKEGFMTVVLERDYHIDQSWHGPIISVPPLFYVIMGNIVGIIVDKAPRRMFICVGFAMMAISNFLMGPSKLLFLPTEFWLFFVGYAINGLSQGAIFIPILPEVQEAIYQKRGLVEGEDEAIDGIINDKAAALYGLFYAVGAIAAPLLGSSIYAGLNENWWSTCDVMGLIAAVWTCIFFVFNIMPDLHKERKQRQEMAERFAAKGQLQSIISVEDVDESSRPLY